MAESHEVEVALAAAWSPEAWSDVTVMVAVSGGADSVALLRLLHRLKTAGAGRLIAGHLNHGLRGAESDADEQFVRQLAQQLGLDSRVGAIPAGELLQRGSDGLEAAARQARYDFLLREATQMGARYLVTAHTADDQAETVLHRILRGTGIAGLAGIRRVRVLSGAVSLVRPMLGLRRSSLRAYLTELDQPFRHDSTNDDLHATRNRLRHELLPELAQSYNPQVVDALLRLGCAAGQVQDVVGPLVEALREEAVASTGPGVYQVDVARLVTQPPYVVRELLFSVWRDAGWRLQSMGHEQWNALADMLAESPDPIKRTFPGNVRAEREASTLRLVLCHS